MTTVLPSCEMLRPFSSVLPEEVSLARSFLQTNLQSTVTFIKFLNYLLLCVDLLGFFPGEKI